MDPSEQLPDHSAGIMSPQSSVDASSRDRAVVTEGKPLDLEWACVICSLMGLEFLACIVYLTHLHTYMYMPKGLYWYTYILAYKPQGCDFLVVADIW